MGLAGAETQASQSAIRNPKSAFLSQAYDEWAAIEKSLIERAEKKITIENAKL